MDYRIRRKTSELKGYGYVEIRPGKYPKYFRKHWQDGNVFIHEEAFTMATGIIVNHYSEYNPFGDNNIPKNIGMKITTEWRDNASQLYYMSDSQVRHALNLDDLERKWIDTVIASHKAEIMDMLRELADICDEFYNQGNWVCIQGV